MATTREIIKPRWHDEAKTTIAATFKYTSDDGSIREAKAVISNTDGTNPDWAEIMDNFSTADIDANTSERIEHVTSVMVERDERRSRREEREIQEKLFDNKLVIFENSHIANSEDVDRKREMRKCENKMDFQVALIDLMIADAFKRAGIDLPAANTTWTTSANT